MSDPTQVPHAGPESSAPPSDGGLTVMLRDAFSLGWEIVEMKGRILVALEEPVYASLRLASVWRAGFSRIATLQGKVFPECTDARTLYEPPPPEALPYLYPPEPDYASVGVSGRDVTATASLKDFTLYDVTRRAVNCLSLLYIAPSESLVPEVIARYQGHLVGAILSAAQDPAGGGGTDLVPGGADDPGEEPTLPAEALPPPGPIPVDPAARLLEARKVLTERTVRFLEAWDGYLRESYYSGGGMPDDNTELIAYEAGRSMGSLSWGISTRTAALAQKHDGSAEELAKGYREAWEEVFRDQDVIRLQHQITALSTALDDAYYRLHPKKERVDDDAVLVKPDLDLPSYTIRTVKNSIDFWQRAVKWVVAHPERQREPVPAGAAPWSLRMRTALNEQAEVWKTLMTGQQSLRAYNMETATHRILEEVMKEIQDSVRQGFGSGIQQGRQTVRQLSREAWEVAEETADIASRGLNELLQRTVRTFWPVMAGALVVGIVLLGVAVMALTRDQGAMASVSGGTGVGALLSAFLGYLGLGKVKGEKARQEGTLEGRHEVMRKRMESEAAAPDPEPPPASGLLPRLQGAAQEAGAVMMEVFDRGYRQIRIELDELNRSVGVSYPLVEFVGLTFDLKSDVAFLTEIIWDGTTREEDLKRVMRAAFGPLSLYLGSVTGKVADAVEERVRG